MNLEKELAATEDRAEKLRDLKNLLAQRDTLAGEVATLQANKQKLESAKMQLEHDAATRERFRDEELYRAAQAGMFFFESKKVNEVSIERFELMRRFLRLRGWTSDASGWKWRDAPAAAYGTLEEAFRIQVAADLQPLRAGLFSAAGQSAAG